MRTDPIDGFLIDRGFQVLFTAYPNADKELVYEDLDLQEFVPGARVFWDGGYHEVRRDDPIAMAFSPFLSIGDKLRTIGLNADLATRSIDDVWSESDVTALEMFRRRGFSEDFIERFARPFFGGVFLDRSLDVSANMLLFAWKMLNEGDTVLPALGIEEVPRQIFADLPSECFAGECEAISVQGGAEPSVRLANGDVIEAKAIVLATDTASAAKLSGLSLPTQFRSSTTVTFAATTRPVDEPVLVLNGDFPGQVNHVATLSAVSPALAPPGQELVSATVLGDPPESDSVLAAEIRYELSQWFPGKDVRGWTPLRVDRVRQAQLVQRPGFHSARPANRTGIVGVYIASECTENGSIDGAALSGSRCADEVLAANAVAVS
jgi:phytoene dehydrogenase-like protein